MKVGLHEKGGHAEEPEWFNMKEAWVSGRESVQEMVCEDGNINKR